MEAGRDPIEVTIKGKKKIVSKIQATAMQLANKAASGNQTAINKFLEWIDEIETRAAGARPAQFPFSPADLDVLRATYERMKQSEGNNQNELKRTDDQNPQGPSNHDPKAGNTER